MRVIAGTYRSRPIAAPRGTETRPTSDRLRETLFNILAQRIEGSRFADLYAGSGAVGIEAISRGAEFVLFSENAASATAAIRANLTSLGIRQNFTVEPGGTSTALKQAIRRNISFDIVFLDPPYEADAEYTRTLLTLGGEAHTSLLAPDAVVIAEHSRKQSFLPRYGDLEHYRTHKQGDAALSFYRIARAESR